MTKDLQIKYTNEDIDRIFEERVKYLWEEAELKPGVICEWTFEYPNGQITADVEAAFCISPEYNNSLFCLRRVQRIQQSRRLLQRQQQSL